MSLVVVNQGMVRCAVQVAVGWPRVRRVGLFANALTPDRHTTLASLVLCTFSGYDGERPLPAWGTAAIEGDRAVVRGDPVLWTYDGGSPTGYVAGYYVVDDDGVLLWVERRPGALHPMVSLGQDYTVLPILSVGTRFGAET